MGPLGWTWLKFKSFLDHAVSRVQIFSLQTAGPLLVLPVKNMTILEAPFRCPIVITQTQNLEASLH